MIKCLAFSLLMALAAASGWPNAGQRVDGNLIRIGLDDDPRATPAPTATPSPDAKEPTAAGDPASCSGVTFTLAAAAPGSAPARPATVTTTAGE